MKKLYMFIGCLLLMAMQVFTSCKSKTEATTAKPMDIPILKARTGPLAATEEWAKTKETVSFLIEKINQSPKDYTTILILAVTYMQEARITGEHPYYYPAAMKLVDLVISGTEPADGIHFKALVAKASILLSQHQFKEALEVGNAALKFNRQQAEIYGVLCDAHVELGNYTQAVTMADAMTQIKPDLRSYARISYLREIFGDQSGAIEAMNMAVAAGLPGAEPKAWTRVTLGKIYEKAGNLIKAEDQYRRALAEYPNYGFAIAGLARLAAGKKEYEKAIQLCEKAEDIIPEFSFTEDKALYYQWSGQEAKGLEFGKLVLKMLKEDQDSGHETGLELTNLYARVLKDYDKALVVIKKEYEKRPQNIDVCHAMAYVLYQKGDLNAAYPLIETASRTNKQDPELMLLKGMIYQKHGKESEGKLLIKKALALNPYMNDALVKQAKSI